MIRNISYRNKELNEEIIKLVGNGYNIIQAFRLKGVGSPRLRVIEASTGFHKFLPKIENGEYCNIEIRPNGIIIRFRYHLDNMAWILPYYKLSIYKSKDHYSIHGNGEYMKLSAAVSGNNPDKFFTKLQFLKAENLPEPL